MRFSLQRFVDGNDIGLKACHKRPDTQLADMSRAAAVLGLHWLVSAVGALCLRTRVGAAAGGGTQRRSSQPLWLCSSVHVTIHQL